MEGARASYNSDGSNMFEFRFLEDFQVQSMFRRFRVRFLFETKMFGKFEFSKVELPKTSLFQTKNELRTSSHLVLNGTRVKSVNQRFGYCRLKIHDYGLHFL